MKPIMKKSSSNDEPTKHLRLTRETSQILGRERERESETEREEGKNQSVMMKLYPSIVRRKNSRRRKHELGSKSIIITPICSCTHTHRSLNFTTDKARGEKGKHSQHLNQKSHGYGTGRRKSLKKSQAFSFPVETHLKIGPQQRRRRSAQGEAIIWGE